MGRGRIQKSEERGASFVGIKYSLEVSSFLGLSMPSSTTLPSSDGD